MKIDALLGRLGVLPEQAGRMAGLIQDAGLELVSLYAHFSNIEDTTDLGHARKQIAAFKQAYDAVKAVFPGVERHLSATSGLMTVESDLASDWVRLGIGLYGLYPSDELAASQASLALRPVLRWVSHLALAKQIPAGHPVGYGLSYIAQRAMVIGIVPQGYSDGYDRGLSNCGEVLVHGQRCPVIGRVAMNMFAIDLTPAPGARAEDQVILLGQQGNDRITAEEMATKLGTINYEAVTRISPLLPRVLVNAEG